MNAGSPLMKVIWWTSLSNGAMYIEATVKTLHPPGMSSQRCLKQWKTNAERKDNWEMTSETVYVNILYTNPPQLCKPCVHKTVLHFHASRRYVPRSEDSHHKLGFSSNTPYKAVILLSHTLPLILQVVLKDGNLRQSLPLAGSPMQTSSTTYHRVGNQKAQMLFHQWSW